jgi:hypothetical protein
VLAVSGGFDMRTPTAGAAAVASRFPHGQLLVVPGIGHSTVDADVSACAALAVHDWMNGRTVPPRCPRPKALVPPVPALPTRTAGRRSGPARTFAVAVTTAREAEAAWLMTAFSGRPKAIPGVFGGRLVLTSGKTFRLVGYSVARGVSLSGKISITKFGPPVAFKGKVAVGGAGASHGVIQLSGGRVRGTIGGKGFG